MPAWGAAEQAPKQAPATVPIHERICLFTDHLDDFTRGVIDTKHLVYYISFISFGLYLTMRSVDTERWRG